MFTPAEKTSTQDSRDVNMHYLYRQLQRNPDEASHQELITELQHRMFEDNLFKAVFPNHANEVMVAQPTDFDCLRFLVDTHDEFCGRFSDYSLKHAKHLVHACETQAPELINVIANVMQAHCSNIM